MKPLKNLKTLGRLGKGTALLVAKPLSLRKPCRPWKSVRKQMLPYCLKATQLETKSWLLFVDVWMFLLWCPKNSREKWTMTTVKDQECQQQKSRINNNNHQQRQQQQQQKVLCLVVWDIFDLTHLDLGCWWCCVQPSWKLISSRLNTQQVEDVDARS